MTRLNFDWQPRYQEALLELDPSRVPALIEQARGAIQQRLTSANFSHAEQSAMEDALHNLEVLSRISKDEAA
jgi:hypothetical protein